MPIHPRSVFAHPFHLYSMPIILHHIPQNFLYSTGQNTSKSLLFPSNKAMWYALVMNLEFRPVQIPGRKPHAWTVVATVPPSRPMVLSRCLPVPIRPAPFDSYD